MSEAPEPSANQDDLGEETTLLAEERTHLAEERTTLALRRTWLAAERTLMAWIRTAVALIALGFSIYRFFLYLQATSPALAEAHLPGPRHLGLALVGLGTVSLAVALRQYQQFVRSLGQPRQAWSLAVLMAVAVILLGLAVFVDLSMGWGPF